MWSDNETSIDLLGFKHLVDAVTSIIKNESLLPTTIGVFGDWGGGKSSLIQMTQAELEKLDDVLVIPFNGWLFEDYEDAKTALLGTILETIADHATLPVKAKDKAKALLKKVNWLRTITTAGKYGLAYYLGGPDALGFAAASDAPVLAKKIGEKVAEADLDEGKKLLSDSEATATRKSIRNFRSDFKELLEDTKIKTVVIVIDDLDRCLPETVIETLEAIKLFLFVEKTAFVIGADERLVQYAVKKRFPQLPGEQDLIGQEYLEKLIQIPIRIPQLSRTEIESYINLLFIENSATDVQMEEARKCVVECAADNLSGILFDYAAAKKILGTIPPELDDNLITAQRIAPILAQGLKGNPRQCKRFLNTLVIRIQMAKSRKVDLKMGILAKLMLLENFKPVAFRQLCDLQMTQNGKPKEITQLEKEAKKKESSGLDNQSEVFIETAESDDWIQAWLKIEPLLSGVDLQNYFFFSRDKLNSFGVATQSMTPEAQNILGSLFGDTDSSRAAALKKAKDISTADAAAVFEKISEMVRREDDHDEDTSAMKRILDWTEKRPELFSQLIGVLAALPHSTLSAYIPVRLMSVGKKTDNAPLAEQLIRTWEQSKESSSLRASAASVLKKK